MPSFLARHKAGMLMTGALLFAWVLALVLSCGHRPSAEGPERWIQGPPVLPAHAAGDAGPDDDSED